MRSDLVLKSTLFPEIQVLARNRPFDWALSDRFVLWNANTHHRRPKYFQVSFAFVIRNWTISFGNMNIHDGLEMGLIRWCLFWPWKCFLQSAVEGTILSSKVLFLSAKDVLSSTVPLPWNILALDGWLFRRIKFLWDVPFDMWWTGNSVETKGCVGL